MTIFDRLGVMPIVNGKGTATRLSGGIARPEVRAAMAEAMTLCVDMAELQACASRKIAGHTGAEAGLVTSGAAAGLLLGTAACIARWDIATMARLPDFRGGRPTVVMARSQRNQYDHTIRTTGALIVEVGLPDRLAGAGCRDAEPWEFDAAITEDTAMVFWVADRQSRPTLDAVIEVAHRRGVPVLVDAAAHVPPRANLRRFIEAGADLVAFSGGKALGGPQASGLLCGRADLIASAALQMLDMDYPEGFFRPPEPFIDTKQLRGTPPHGIGRPCKVGKEQVVGLLTALDLFAEESDETGRERWMVPLRSLMQGLGELSGLDLEMRDDGPVPCLAIMPESGAQSAQWLYRLLIEGRPSIHVEPEEIGNGRLIVNPLCLADGDVERIVERMRMLVEQG